MIDITMKRNPTGRMTTPQDVANAILALSGRGHRVHQRRHHQRRRRRVHHRRRLGRPSRMSGRVIVVGSVNVDLVVTTERLPAPGRDGHRRAVRPASRRQGRQPGRRGGPAGRDRRSSSGRSVATPSGPMRARRSRRRASTVTGLLTLPDDEPTGVALILVDAAGENSIAVAGGANAALGRPSRSATALKRLALTRDDVVLVGHEIRTGATHEALRLGRLAGATTILNPAPAGWPGAAHAGPRRRAHPERGRARGARRRGRRPGARRQAPARARSRRPRRPGQPRRARRAPGRGRPVQRAIHAPRPSRSSTRSGRATRSTGHWPRPGGGLDLSVEAARRAVVAASLAVTRAGAREGMPTPPSSRRRYGVRRPARPRRIASDPTPPRPRPRPSRAWPPASSRHGPVVGDPPGGQAA